MPEPDSPNRQPNRPLQSDHGLSDTEFKRDQVLGGRYKVLSLLGRGGMGIVYRVEQIFLGKELALKTIEKRTMTDVIVKRFRAEAKAAFAVDHPNIVAVHDFGVFDEETPFLVMEIVEGTTLGDRIKRGVLPLKEALPIFVQVCFGLAHAHACGVVHRDIKPNNIMIISERPEGIEGGVKILDFGIAKIAQSDDGEIQALTRTGEIFGSPLYMSPEQCIGAKVDYRADIYSLGCVMFEALTGSPPFIGDNALSTMMLHQTSKTPTLKEVSMGETFPPELEKLLQSMMAKDPNQRLQSLGEAAMMLGAISKGDSGRIAPPQVKRAIKSKPTGPTVTIDKSNLATLHLSTAFASIFITSILMFLFDEPKPQVIYVQETKLEAQQDHVEDGPALRNSIEKGERWVTLSSAADNFSLRVLNEDKNLRSLLVREAAIDDDGLRHLENTKLLYISLHHCDMRTVENLCKLSYLQNIDLTANQITDDSIAQIAKSLKQLQTLAITECDLITEDGLMTLPTSTSLSNLAIGDNHYSPEKLQALQKKMPQLTITQSNYKQIDSRLHKFDKTAKGDKIAVAKQRLQLAMEGGPLNWEVGNSYLGLGLLYASKKQFREAEEMIKKADDTFKKTGNLRLRVDPLIHLTNLARYRGDIPAARELSQLAAQTFIDTVPDSSGNLYAGYQNLIAIPAELKDYATVLKICKAAISSLDAKTTDAKERTRWLPNFYYFASWSASLLGEKEEAREYAAKNFEYTKQFLKTAQANQFYRAEIFHAHTMVKSEENQRRKDLYTNAIAEIEAAKFPDDISLKEHYCDACENMAVLLAAENKKAEAIGYLNKALSLLKTIKHSDTTERVERIIKRLKEISTQTTQNGAGTP